MAEEDILNKGEGYLGDSSSYAQLRYKEGQYL